MWPAKRELSCSGVEVKHLTDSHPISFRKTDPHHQDAALLGWIRNTNTKQTPDPKQARDSELALEGQRSSDHLRKIKVPDPAPELAPDTELVPDLELARTPDPTIIWLVIIGTWFSITS
jgi:hypothetical protein